MKAFTPADRRQTVPEADEDGLSGADGAGGEPLRVKVGVKVGTAPDFSQSFPLPLLPEEAALPA